MRARSVAMPSVSVYCRRPVASAACAAAIAHLGAGAAGCPTSMWMTCVPLASMRAAAAITSITMNGGTSLRAEAAVSRFAASSGGVDFLDTGCETLKLAFGVTCLGHSPHVFNVLAYQRMQPRRLVAITGGRRIAPLLPHFQSGCERHGLHRQCERDPR